MVSPGNAYQAPVLVLNPRGEQAGVDTSKHLLLQRNAANGILQCHLQCFLILIKFDCLHICNTQCLYRRSPGAIQIQNFDFRTQNAFSVWGFKNLKDLKIFDTFWNNFKLLKSLSQNINNKQQELLAQWG